jgi:uncharacterized protein YndB with AHSA1/START domain
VKPSTSSPPGQDQKFVITRIFDAPRDLMFKVWTECEHLNRWWGPKSFVMRHCKVDLRPGGLFHYRIQSPDGLEMWGKFVYREIVAPERLVFISSFSDENAGITTHPMAPNWPREILSTITFTERDGKTEVKVEWLPHEATELERQTFLEMKDSMNKGWTGTFEQLEGYLSGVSRS